MKLIRIDADTYVNTEAIATVEISDYYEHPNYEKVAGKKVRIITVNDGFITLKIFDDPNADNEKAARQYIIDITYKLNSKARHVEN